MNKTNFATVLLLFLSLFLCMGETIDFYADSLRNVSAEGKKYTRLSGSAYVKTGSKEIRANEITLFGEDFGIIICTGNVEVRDTVEDFSIKSQHFYYERLNKLTRINGRSVMEDFKNEMIIKSGYMEYREEENKLNLQIGVRILKESLTCRCEFAVYDKDKDLLIMTGLPIVYKDSDIFSASSISVLLKNDEIMMDGKVEGSLLIKDKETNGPATKEDQPQS